MITLNSVPEIGAVIEGFTVTEVREDGIVFGVEFEGEDVSDLIAKIKAHEALPKAERSSFFFRPGIRFAKLTAKAKRSLK